MHVQWYGQSAFLFTGDQGTVFVDPFDLAEYPPGVRWDYPEITGVAPDLLLISHENADHNGAAVIDGEPQVLRSWGGTFQTKIGPVKAIVGEHDRFAGIERGPIFMHVFELGGVRVCHMGDFGQRNLRPEQREAMGDVDLLLIPVGGAQTIDGATAAAVVEEVRPRWVMPMHYKTAALDAMAPVDDFLSSMNGAQVVELPEPSFETDDLPRGDAPIVLMPEPPLRDAAERPFVTP